MDIIILIIILFVSILVSASIILFILVDSYTNLSERVNELENQIKEVKFLIVDKQKNMTRDSVNFKKEHKNLGDNKPDWLTDGETY